MGRQDVFEILKNNKGIWLDSRKISELTGLNVGNVNRSLNNMRKAKDPVKVKNTSKKKKGITYRKNVYKYEDAIDNLLK